MYLGVRGKCAQIVLHGPYSWSIPVQVAYVVYMVSIIPVIGSNGTGTRVGSNDTH